MQLEDRFYTSTEVAEILGVSLRSIYRYLDENRLNAEIKTATGRHRFTRKNIMDFLYPVPVDGAVKVEVDTKTKEGVKVAEKVKITPVEIVEPTVEPIKEEVVIENEVEDEGVDWLAKFRAAAEKHRREAEVSEEVVKEESVVESPKQSVSGLTDMAGPSPEVESNVEVGPESLKFNFYRSGVGGLKEIAQNIDKSARKASVDYAFTMSAGLSLHKPIKPFSLIHAYVKSGEKDFFERMLQLTSATESTAQVCLIVSDDTSIYANAKEMHGLYVVSNEQLKKDLMDNGEMELAKELGA